MLYILIVKRFELFMDFALYKINLLYYYVQLVLKNMTQFNKKLDIFYNCGA